MRALPVRAFSLLELLISMTLIIIMFVMMHSRSSKGWQERQKLACQQNLQAIHVALRVYAMEHTQVFPVVPGATTSEAPLTLLVPRYTTATEHFICPGTKQPPLPSAAPFGDARISYAYYMGRSLNDGPDCALLSDAQVDTAARMKGQTMFSQDGKKPGGNHRRFGGNVLFSDGHAETFPSAAARNLALTNGVVLLNPRP